MLNTCTQNLTDKKECDIIERTSEEPHNCKHKGLKTKFVLLLTVKCH